MKTFLRASILLLILTTFGCSTSDDSSDTNFLENEKFFAKVNGANFVSGDPWVGASYAATPNASALAIIAASSDSPFSGKAIGITWSTSEENFELQSGQVFTHQDLNVTLIGVYAESNDDDYDFDEMVSMRLEITNIDKVNKLISGKFNFVVSVENASGQQKTYNVTEGVFTDLSYDDD